MKCTHPHTHDSSDTLITLKDGIPTTTSLAIAEGTGNSHEAVIKLVRNYRADLEEFGLVRFEIRPRLQGQHGGGDVEFAHLNEHQSTLILTYMKNTAIIRAFKIRLVKAFYEMAEAQQNHPNLDMIQNMIDKSVTQAVTAGLGNFITQMVESQVDAHVTAKLKDDPRVAIEAMISAKQILDEEKVPSKGRRGLVLKASHSLLDYCLQTTGATAKRCARTRTWLYPIAVKNQWLKLIGRTLIADHMSAIYGQLKLDLVPMPNVKKEEVYQ
ncbi:MAG: Rha family transcriptional regulator [Magnetococcales bacterium]|nr:Rha family transcriptional regulator [Magnetococcales bacterium]